MSEQMHVSKQRQSSASRQEERVMSEAEVYAAQRRRKEFEQQHDTAEVLDEIDSALADNELVAAEGNRRVWALGELAVAA